MNTMKNLDDVLEKVKQKTEWKTDYKIGRALGYSHTAQVSGWRRRVAMPSNHDLIIMCDEAGIDLGEAIRAVEYSRKNERQIKQAGYATVATMSLTAVTALAYMGVMTPLTAGILYIMSNKESRFKIEGELNNWPIHEFNHLVAANDCIAA